MQLKGQTLQKLREIINGDGIAYYKSGPKLVEFFNSLCSNDHYGQGFPSRWVYTDENLKWINGTPALDKCIKKIFSVEDHIENIEELDQKIADFNKYLAFDKWQVVRENDTITFKRQDKVVVAEPKKASADIQEDDFLKLTFDVNVDALKLDASISDIIKQRLHETELCVNHDAPLAAVFLIGSVLEGVLLGTASDFPRQFNQAQSAPRDKDAGKVKIFSEWTLNNMIDAAAEIGVTVDDDFFFDLVGDMYNVDMGLTDYWRGFFTTALEEENAARAARGEGPLREAPEPGESEGALVSFDRPF